MRSGAWGIAALAILAAGLPGCFDDGGAVFGPVAGDDGEGDEASGLLPVSFKAKPARGPTPLEAEFFLHVTGVPDLEWSIDFGDGGAKATGDKLPGNASHTFTKLGEHDVIATVGTGSEATKSRLTIEVLEADAPPADPEEEVEGETIPPSSSSSSSSSSTGAAGSDEADDGDDGGGSEPSSSSSSSSSQQTTAPPPPPPPPPASSSTSTTPPPPPPPSSSSSTSSAPPPPQPPPPQPSSSSTSSAPPPPPSDNEPPRATLTSSRTSGSAPLDVAFSMDASDPEGAPIQWTLDIRNDGSVEASGDRFDLPRTVNGHFDSPGTYVTVLTVTDGVTTTTRSVTITVS